MTPATGQSPAVPGQVEIVILGAGIAGLTAAFRLAKAGCAVLVLDRSRPWQEGSAVNAGTLALQNKRLDLLTFFKEAVEEWARLKEELGVDIGHVRAGGVRVASSPADVEALRRSAAEQARLGVETEWLEGQSLRARAPWLGPRIACATFCRADGFANPLLVGPALIGAVTAAGGRVAAPVRLVGTARSGNGFRLETDAGPIACRKVMIAAGPWSGRVAGLFGMTLPIGEHINMLTVTERIAPFMDHHVVTHIGGRLTLKQFLNGSCVLGGGWRGRGDSLSGRKDLDCVQLVQNLRLHTEVVPHLKTASALRSWAGFETDTPDGWPIVGRAPQDPELFLAIPARAGFAAGALVGRLVAEIAVSGKVPSLAERFGPERFLP